MASCSSFGAGGDGGAADDAGHDGELTDDGGLVFDDGGADGGDETAEVCAGLSDCGRIRVLLEDAQRCAPEKAARFSQAVDSVLRGMKAPCLGDGEAIFLYYGQAQSVSVAGEFSAWAEQPMEKLCGLDLWALRLKLALARYEYKLVIEGTWKMDPANRAFAYDDFEANPDRKNSVVNLPGSHQSHLEWWPGVICNELGNGRDVIVYVPPDYFPEEDRRYPALNMHDGQNIFDNSTCCFGNGGWWVNVAADQAVV